MIVFFKDRTPGVPDSVLWNFGDGQTSTLRTVAHEYFIEGTYTVTLTVVSGGVPETYTTIVTVTSFKTELISDIKSIADTYGLPSTKAYCGASGAGWNNISGKYGMLETIVEGVANAETQRTIDRGHPYLGTLIKGITGFEATTRRIFMEDLDGVITGDSFVVAGSNFNDGGKQVSTYNRYVTGEQYVTVPQKVNDEIPVVPIEVEFQPPEEDLNIESTIYRIQASVHDTMPGLATTTEAGFVFKGTTIDLIPAPADNQEVRVNQIILSLRGAKLI